MTEYQKFTYQCRLVGITFDDFCDLTELYPADARTMLESKGGRNELIGKLAMIRMTSITVGDVVEVLSAKGLSCSVSPMWLRWIDSHGADQGVRVDCHHTQRQDVLGRVLIELEEPCATH